MNFYTLSNILITVLFAVTYVLTGDWANLALFGCHVMVMTIFECQIDQLKKRKKLLLDDPEEYFMRKAAGEFE